MRRSELATLVALAFAPALPACLGGALSPTTAEAPRTAQSCRVGVSQERPLVTEWPASEKAALEANLKSGPVLVAYSGCEMSVLAQCRVAGAYAWQRTTAATDSVEIANEDELYAKLPLGAVSLEGELRRSGRLAVTTTTGGQFRLGGFEAASVPGGPACAKATHVIDAVVVGAFEMRSGGTLAVSGGVDVAAIGSASGSSRSSESLMRRAGDPARCAEATDALPHGDCASPVQVSLRALPESVTDRGPPGAVKLTFEGSTADEKWTVGSQGRELCTTPCERWVDPRTPLAMTEGGSLFRPQGDDLEVEGLQGLAPGSRATARAHGTDDLEWLGGLTAITIGGLATVAGITLFSIGAASEDSSLTGGSIGAFIPGVLVLGLGVYLLIDASGNVEVAPAPFAAGANAGEEVPGAH